jgi:hypothetical protein
MARDVAFGGDLVEAVADELTRQGAEEASAAELAREVIGRYPLVGRLGLAGVVREARRAGLDDSTAEESAIWLAAWEALRRGVTFSSALEQLEVMCSDRQRARAALLDAARFLRQSSPHPGADAPDREPARATLARRTAQALLIFLAAASWVALGERWLASF